MSIRWARHATEHTNVESVEDILVQRLRSMTRSVSGASQECVRNLQSPWNKETPPKSEESKMTESKVEESLTLPRRVCFPFLTWEQDCISAKLSSRWLQQIVEEMDKRRHAHAVGKLNPLSTRVTLPGTTASFLQRPFEMIAQGNIHISQVLISLEKSAWKLWLEHCKYK